MKSQSSQLIINRQKVQSAVFHYQITPGMKSQDQFSNICSFVVFLQIHWQKLYYLLVLLMIQLIIQMYRQTSNNKIQQLLRENSSTIKAQESQIIEAQNHFERQKNIKIEELSNSKRWIQVQHMKYLIFLEKNREKIKSKLIRRSNSFFREMSVFIESKSPIQCRSYHQKYENKHKYPHRIIRQEKAKLDEALYQTLWNAQNKKNEKSQLHLIRKDLPSKTQTTIQKKQNISVEIQTDIQGINTILVSSNDGSSGYHYQTLYPDRYHFYVSDYPMMNYRQFNYPFWN